MRGNHCMSGERTDTRRQSIVGPLRGDQGAKSLVRKTPLKVLLGGLQGKISCKAIHHPNHPGQERRHSLRHDETVGPTGGAPQVAEILLDIGALVWKSMGQSAS